MEGQYKMDMMVCGGNGDIIMLIDVYNILTYEYKYWIKLYYFLALSSPILKSPELVIVIYPRGRKKVVSASMTMEEV
jgi:hypothetical protein